MEARSGEVSEVRDDFSPSFRPHHPLLEGLVGWIMAANDAPNHMQFDHTQKQTHYTHYQKLSATAWRG
jgi:hypothetical protein